MFARDYTITIHHIYGTILFLSKRTECLPFWSSQTYRSNYSPWKISIWWERKPYILWERVKWSKVLDKSDTVVVVPLSLLKREWALYNQCAIEISWLILFLIFWKPISIPLKWTGSGRVYCGCYYFCVVAILREGVYWFRVLGRYMETWNQKLIRRPSLLFHFLSI